MIPSTEPYNEERYQAMMDGLKIKEVSLETVINANSYFRLEADYFLSATTNYAETLKGKDIIQKTQYGTSQKCDESSDGYSVLRLNELDNGFIERPLKKCSLLTKEEYEDLRLNKGDVLIVRTNGNPELVGRSAIVMEDTSYAFASYLFRVVPNNRINASTLVVYLNSSFGRKEINRNSMKGNQTNFSPEKFRDINIPSFSDGFQLFIERIVDRAYREKIKSKTAFSDAVSFLQSYLNVTVSTERPISQKMLSDSFVTTGRLDADYFQPKYQEIIDSLNTNETVSSLCHIYDENYDPKYETKYKYIELADVGSYGDIGEIVSIDGKDLPTRARRIISKGQIIVSSVEGSIEKCAFVSEENDGALCSTGFYVLDSDRINSETLLVLFKSEPIQALMKQRCSGTILTAISKEELQSMPLPYIDEDIQKQIAAKIQESFALRRKSKELLEYAKQAVEMAIELGEDTALTWLSDKVG